MFERRSKLSIKLGFSQFSLWGGSPEVAVDPIEVASCIFFNPVLTTIVSAGVKLSAGE